MAKRKSVQVDTSKARLELRFDTDVAEGITKLADGAGISVNQLMQGLARWAVNLGKLGEAEVDEFGVVTGKPQPGCLWFGREIGEEERQDHLGDVVPCLGYVAMQLDFTERRVVREVERKSERKGGRK